LVFNHQDVGIRRGVFERISKLAGRLGVNGAEGLSRDNEVSELRMKFNSGRFCVGSPG
jgi:hypothetical protein